MTRRSCTSCGSTHPLTAEFFFRNAKNKSGFESVCIECRGGAIERQQDRQHQVRRRKHELAPPRQHICSACSNLPHRRPAGGCPRCGKPRAQETPMTLSDASSFTVDRTTFPGMGSWE